MLFGLRPGLVQAIAATIGGLMLILLPTTVVSPVVAQEAPQLEPEYVIVPGDSLSITVMDQADLTRTITVRPDGKINLPLIGELLVAGKTPAQASTMITEAFAVYLKQPIVTVTVAAFAPRPVPRVMVLGSVRAPGPYAFPKGARVIDAIVLAGWIADRAALDAVGLIRRDAEGQLNVTRVNLDKIIDGKGDPAQNVMLVNSDIVFVPQHNRILWRDILQWISGLSLIRAFFGLP